MVDTRIRPSNITRGDGVLGNGTVQGGPFAEDFLASVTSLFGPRAPFADPDSWDGEKFTRYTNSFHIGLDLSAPGIAGTPLYPLMDGVVELSYFDEASGVGNVVRVRVSPTCFFDYMHMESPALYAVGQNVTRTDVVGYVGNTGNSTGPHLHMQICDLDVQPGEIAVKDFMLDPMAYLERGLRIGQVIEPPAPQVGDAVPAPSVHQALELQYVFGKGTTVSGGEIVALDADRVLQVEGQVNYLIPAGKLVRRYTVDVPVLPEPTWIGR